MVAPRTQHTASTNASGRNSRSLLFSLVTKVLDKDKDTTCSWSSSGLGSGLGSESFSIGSEHCSSPTMLLFLHEFFPVECLAQNCHKNILNPARSRCKECGGASSSSSTTTRSSRTCTFAPAWATAEETTANAMRAGLLLNQVDAASFGFVIVRTRTLAFVYVYH